MSDHTPYLEQRELEARVEKIERECRELRWLLSSREVYAEELRIAADRLARLQAAGEDDEESATVADVVPSLGTVQDLLARLRASLGMT